MKKTRIAINGFGRIGRLAARIALEFDDVELVAINTRADTKTRAHLFKYDSKYGISDVHVEALDDEYIQIKDQKVRCFAIKDLKDIPWKEVDADWVIESTGKFRDDGLAYGHIESGAKKVLVSSPAKGVDGTFVMGVNHATYDPEKHQVVSNASCTTNCLGPVCSVLQNNWGIKRGTMSTVHSTTSDQKLHDASHRDLRRARSATQSMIPTGTGSARAIGKVIPELEGKLHAISIRVPTVTVSLVDLTCELDIDEITVPEIEKTFREAMKEDLKGILDWTNEELVAIDFRRNPHSAIVDGGFTHVQDKNLLQILAWYDNEWAYAHRVIDFIRYAASRE